MKKATVMLVGVALMTASSLGGMTAFAGTKSLHKASAAFASSRSKVGVWSTSISHPSRAGFQGGALRRGSAYVDFTVVASTLGLGQATLKTDL